MSSEDARLRNLVEPFLGRPRADPVGSNGQLQPLQSTLPQIASSPATSPWTPRPTAVDTLPVVDVEPIRASAREAGRAEGLAETEQLRARLRGLVGDLERVHGAIVDVASERIADAAAVVVESWCATTGRAALFGPVVRAWLGHGDAPAIARVHPDDVAELRLVVGDAGLAIEPDPTLAPGDIKIRGAHYELTQCWDARLRELRAVIAQDPGAT